MAEDRWYGSTPPKTDLRGNKKQLSHKVLYWWETPPYCAVQSLRRWMIECQLSVCGHCCIICFIFHIFFDRPMTPVTASDPVVEMVSGSFWICCCHSCHVCTSNCLSEESAPWGPSAKPGFRSVYPHWDSVSMQCPQNLPPPARRSLLTVSMRSLGDDRRWCKRHTKEGRENDYYMRGQVKVAYGGKANEEK